MNDKGESAVTRSVYLCSSGLLNADDAEFQQQQQQKLTSFTFSVVSISESCIFKFRQKTTHCS